MLAAGAATAGGLVATDPAGASGAGAAVTPAPTSTTGFLSGVPTFRPRANIVFVLTDDLSMDLLPFMPQVQELESQGMTFNDYFVSDSLCCPSRASIFTGNFPHDTGVYSNVGPDGGIRAFYAHDDEQQTFNVALQRAGYVTAMMGKYLNGYLEPKQSPVSDTYVPPGWNVWDVAGNGYPEFNYELNENGRLHYYGRDPDDYLTNVLAEHADDFIRAASLRSSPFFLEVATFAPHRPYTPAPKYANAFPGLQAPEPPNFDRLPTNPPEWLAGHKPLSARQIREINQAYQERVEDVQSVDNLVTSIERTLVEHRELSNTYIVFSSDNGLHTGEYRLMPGKLTAFDTDIRVPLVVAGPGVRAGSSTDAMTENIDLAKTFTAIGGTSMPGDGHSLMPLLKGEQPTDWRDAVLVEHHGPDLGRTDPDAQNFDSGNPTTYEAMRTPDFLYVEYADGEREYYDLRTDPYELDNIARDLSPAELARLHRELGALKRCHGGTACWAAGHVPLGR
jgi:N-acetylglucosamine-6-sulfatase